MRIGIDIRKYHDFGIGTYIRNLLAEFERRQEDDWVYFLSSAIRADLPKHYRGRCVVTCSAKYSPVELFSMSRLANREACDLFHSPHYTFPYGLAGRGVVTIHDLIHLRVPESVSSPNRAYARFLIGHACRASDRVIVDSEFTKQDILGDFRIPARKIHVVPLGVSPAFRPGRGDLARLAHLGIRRPYVLYSGALKAHKNVPTLMQAFSLICAKHDVDLVISGESLGDRPELIDLARRLGIADRVISTGRRGEDEVVALNQHASVAVLPSRYEGFGLSVLEAMACGVPVVAADATSIPEVLGDAGLLFEPGEADDLARALERILTDAPLREEMSAKGLARAGEFTWQRCAQMTLDVYREVCAS
jgi:glycosyltransferase involved in cell wall biosynthesis